MLKNLKGFTLSEILIALSVVGVVASLILPNLIAGNKAATAKAQFNTAYALITKAFADMDADNINIKPSAFVMGQTLYSTLKQYQRVTTDCGAFGSAKNDSVCIAFGGTSGGTDNYKTFNNGTILINRFDDGAFVINNGMLFAMENPGGVNGYVWVSIDINGKNKLPNRWGWDLFTFEVTNDGILPLGAPGTTAAYSNNPQSLCSDNGNSNENGSTCGFFAATRDDYFTRLYRGH